MGRSCYANAQSAAAHIALLRGEAVGGPGETVIIFASVGWKASRYSMRLNRKAEWIIPSAFPS